MIVISAHNAQSQIVRFKLNLLIQNNGTGSTFGQNTLVFGVHERATYCLDLNDTLKDFSDGGSLVESELPPPPPTEIFDVRFIDPRGASECLGQGTAGNIHRFTDTTQIDTFQIRLQAGNGGYPLTFRWSPNFRFYCDSMRLKDLFGGFLVNVNMLTDSMYVLTNTLVDKLNIYMYGPKVPPQPPSAPQLSSPSDGATNQPASVTLTWQVSSGATLYRVQVSTDSTFAAVFYEDTAASTSENVSNLSPLTTYFWRVSASNQFGTSNYSAPFRFTTRLFPPSAPTLVSPPDGASNVSVSPTLLWNRATLATSYHVQVARDQSFAMIVTDADVSDTLLQVGPLENCVSYYWRVRASNDAGAGAYSTARIFTVAAAIPNAPVLVSPTNGATGVSERPTLVWRGDACTQSFTLQVDTSTAFSSPIVAITTSETTYTFQFSLSALTQYYWRVRSSNTLGSSSYTMNSFTTTDIVTPQTPRPDSPHNGATEVPLTPTLQWHRVPQVEHFHLQVARDSQYNVLIVNDSLLRDTFATIGPLLSGTKFYWHIRAKNAAGASPFSESFTFTTLVVAPAAPFLISPPNGTNPAPIRPTLEWNLSYGATSYRLQVARDSSFTQRVFDDSTIMVPSWEVGPLTGGTIYYWRVNAKNSAGVSPFSETWWFKTTYTGVANWIIPLSVRESGFARDTVYFGVNPSATYGIDPSLGEYELPPATPGFFDVRFVDIPSRPAMLGEGVRLNLLPFRTYTQVDSFKLTFQPGNGSYPFTISWPRDFVKEICDSMLIIDEFNGFAVRVRMDNASSVQVTNTSISSLVIIKWGSIPLLVDVNRTEKKVPSGYTLYPNFPNPFNPTTEISFSAEHDAYITLAVYDVLGQEVVSLVQGFYRAGSYSVRWNGRTQRGEEVPSGVYFARLTAQSTSEFGKNAYITAQRMVLMK
jgi:hypothetical protein